MMHENQCRYCCRFADDCADVELRPDGETWKECYPSRICGECRKHLNQTRQFRYLRRPATTKPTRGTGEGMMSKVNLSCQGAGVVPTGVISCSKCGRLWASLRAYENHECVTRLELIYWLLRAYQSGHREGWEPGPSTNETMDRILDILANAGYDPNNQKAKDLMAEFEAGSGYCKKHSCWNCDSDYGQHQEGYCPDNDNYEPTDEELDAHYKAIAEPYKGAL